MKSPASAAVLSALPLGGEAREALLAEFGSDVRFLDLQALRRLSLTALFATLRGAGARYVIVSGTDEELQQFRDYLAPLAAAVPGQVHEIRPSGGAPARMSRARTVLPMPGRTLWALAAGCGAVFLTWIESAVSLARPAGARRRPARLERCLYLKPGLNFGRPVGGSVAHVAGVVNALSRRGVEVSVVASQPQAGVAPTVPQLVKRATFALSSSHELNQHRYRRRFGATALAEGRRQAPDFIYQRFALNDLSGARLRRALGIPLVVEFNGSEVWVQRYWGKRLVFERAADSAERASLRAADLVVAVSTEVAEQALRAGVDPARIACIPNGVDASEFDPARFGEDVRAEVRKRFGIPGDALLYTFVGTFGAWHGTDVLASAILSLREKSAAWLRETRAHFLFVGDGPLGAEARGRLAIGVSEGLVTFAGLRDHGETPSLLAASDVLLAPHKPNEDGSPFFGSPTKLFEYMSMARLIVASDLDQIGEVLRGYGARGEARGGGDAPAGILVRPGDPDSLAEGMRRAGSISDSDRMELGRRARETVLRDLTWDRNVETMVQHLLEGAIR